MGKQCRNPTVAFNIINIVDNRIEAKTLVQAGRLVPNVHVTGWYSRARTLLQWLIVWTRQDGQL